MADVLKTKVSDLETVDEKYRGVYEEKDGAFFLATEGVDSLELVDTGNLKGALQQATTRAETAESSLKTVTEKFGDLDPDEARVAFAKIAEWDEGNVDFEKEVQRKLQSQADKMGAKHQEEIEGERGKSTKYRSTIDVLMVDNKAIKMCEATGGDVKLMLPHYQGRMRCEEDGDDWKTVILDKPGGDPMFNGDGKAASLEDLGKEFVKEFPGAHDGPKSSGTGSGTTGGGAAPGDKTMKRAEFDQMSPTSKKEFMDAKGIVED